ncbi:hypothetical protein AQJ46_07255 [Streptomyces canus]|uniref:Uncharacterized protein n=1 Tax=Streptomyces canus TaxID=58343 RepID=A0A124I098_9ACTN|nr:hypothetical protein AQJ46_07255 [Streptomyces canus]
MTLYDVTLPGEPPVAHMCGGCEEIFHGIFGHGDLQKWYQTVERRDAEALRLYIQQSRAHELHRTACAFRCLPPAVVALSTPDQLRAELRKVQAILPEY